MRKRKAVQFGFGLLQNAYIKGFLDKSIYSGRLKKLCVPGLNCHSCPGALGACPIGGLQSLFDGRRRQTGFYVLGWLAMAGILAGRFVCGWLCLFGLIQELLYMIPVPKITVPEKADRKLRYLKYVILALFVVVLPLAYRGGSGSGVPFFCKYICPAGTLEAGVPLVLLWDGMRGAVGGLFLWKSTLLVLTLAASMMIYRPFCRYICPLGAFYALFQKISFTRLALDKSRCIDCGRCTAVCKMGVNVTHDPNSAECIRCGECVSACPEKALHFGYDGRVRPADGEA
ncbi:MAG: 4Fe-4S binding protein [Firmicutes bacterium]|nr:4Fe-4S binding protein [Bacillota bacterium]